MEDDMSFCNRHDTPIEMKLVGNRWVCTDCGWGYDVPVRISMADLVAENKRLRNRINEMEIMLQQVHRQ